MPIDNWHDPGNPLGFQKLSRLNGNLARTNI